MTLTIALVCAAVLLALRASPSIIGRSPTATRVVYGASIVVAAISLSLRRASSRARPAVGASRCRSACRGSACISASTRSRRSFLVVVDLGAVSASLFALGYGEHETAPQRVLPFYPAFLAGMNLVVVADDAFTFLVSWEFMSLTSWALVMSHHSRARELARRLRLSGHGELRHAHAAAGLRPARRPGGSLHIRAMRAAHPPRRSAAWR